MSTAGTRLIVVNELLFEHALDVILLVAHRRLNVIHGFRDVPRFLRQFPDFDAGSGRGCVCSMCVCVCVCVHIRICARV